ncbi:sushi domain-containing protein 2 isoform X2 [Ictalurus punctatus]|uniref:Sushi domain-containing protein 2 n=1 Tax=Ictalurus punctatus TaxID=7998 RepID=W5UBW0_ICTPU|nr:sushi domain-containing protein 2 isoform X2 [Ictalurus punctatus]
MLMYRVLTLCSVLTFLDLISQPAAAQSCEGRCGEKLASCSCHPTCETLLNCCTDVKQFCLDISPHSGSLLGGTDFKLLNVKFDQNVKLTCRFKSEITTQGYVDAEGVGHCISPLLFESGWIPFKVSTDGLNYNRAGRWLSVHHSKLSAEYKLLLVNGTQWQYYGTPGVGGILLMVWNSSLIKAARVNLELWGYDEFGEPYTDRWRAEWKYLYSVGKNVSNNGAFSFVPTPMEMPLALWHMGSMRVSPSTEPDGTWNVNALWSGDHALAYHLEDAFRKDSAAWALEKCLKWDGEENLMPSFLNEIIDCPCTLAQARADTGRFHTDYGCDIEKGSKCTYHPGAVHCVRGIQGSPKYAAGQQCCYDKTGAQVLTSDSIGGSTPDRGHDWGSPPYKKPPKVPSFSHWKYDVITFYYCCLWSDNCEYYFTHRPSSDCRTYQPPKAASVLGDPHFITFDGSTYTFNGKGEYVLLHSPEYQLTVQGRTEPMKSENGSVVMATRLSSVAMKENNSDVIEVRLADKPDHLQVLQNRQVLSFSEQTWMDLEGVFVFSAVPQNVTVMFPSGAGLEIRGRGGVMTLTVLLPQEFKKKTQGLLGKMNDDPEDDLTSSDGTVVGGDSSAQDIFTFGAGWAITNESSLFTYDSEHLLNEYYFSPKHDPSFIPQFSVSEDASDPLLNPTLKMCVGDGARFCKYDTLSTRSLELGNNTLHAVRAHAATTQDLQPVVSCGWIQPPKHGQKEGTLYLEGANVRFSCNHGYRLYGSQERVCQEDGRWSGEDTHCVSDNILGIVLGSVGAVLTVVVMVIAIVLYTRKQKRERMRQRENKAVYQHNTANL